jgi:hypothetical protein
MHFNNGDQIEIKLINSPVTTALEKIFKHLQHVPLNFKKWDNPFYVESVAFSDLVSELVTTGDALGIQVDASECIALNQLYYNQLHKIYETNYNGDPRWLDFHEHIHLCELHYRQDPLRSVLIDYRERAGPLTKSFDNSYLSNIVTDIVPGMVYIQWTELGKRPYNYWIDNEPNNLDRLCQLSKPWTHLRPKLCIATQHINLLDDIDPGFFAWWNQYESAWCKHWQLDNWPITYQAGVIHIGTIDQVDTMIDLFQQQIPVERITLQ